MDPILKAKLDQILQELKDANNLNRRSLTRSFALGIAYGLGATVGIAILFAILTFVIGKLGGVPVIGEWLIKFGSYLHR